MKNTIYYIFSLGLAFYAGGKFLSKTVYKIEKVEKLVPGQCAESKTILKLREENKNCISEYNNLVSSANRQIQDLEYDLDQCEIRYRDDYGKVLKPEEIKETEPTLESEGYKEENDEEYYQ